MYDDLLGYLLGALEPHEMRQVAEQLKRDPELRVELAEIERLLGRLEAMNEPGIEDPPRDLVSRTLANLPPLPSASPSHSPSVSSRGSDAASAVAGPAGSERSLGLAPMRMGVEPPLDLRPTWLDWAGGAAAVAVLLALLLPSLAQGRFEARKAACQDQLRQFGTAITQFVTRSDQSRLPAVSDAGPEAFAGVYAVRLREAGLMDDPDQRWCPSLDRPQQADVQWMEIDQVPSVDELHDASVDRLKEIQRFVGGHYAYTLGVVDQNRFSSPRYEARSSFAVMSDAPMTGIVEGDDQLSSRIGHRGEGINVLFEDGRVQFVQVDALIAMPDHPLVNHHGEGEAGVNIDDASLAPSWRPPFVDARQR